MDVRIQSRRALFAFLYRVNFAKGSLWLCEVLDNDIFVSTIFCRISTRCIHGQWYRYRCHSRAPCSNHLFSIPDICIQDTFHSSLWELMNSDMHHAVGVTRTGKPWPVSYWVPEVVKTDVPPCCASHAREQSRSLGDNIEQTWKFCLETRHLKLSFDLLKIQKWARG